MSEEKKVRAVSRPEAKTIKQHQTAPTVPDGIANRRSGAIKKPLDIHGCWDERTMYFCTPCDRLHCRECDPHRKGR